MKITISNSGRVSVASTGLVRRLGPRAWWKNLDGPPGHGKSPVWEHPNGARLHVGGLLKLPGGASVYEHDRRYSGERMLAEIMQPPPRRIRALMVWAELIMSPPNADVEAPPRKTPNQEQG